LHGDGEPRECAIDEREKVKRESSTSGAEDRGQGLCTSRRQTYVADDRSIVNNSFHEGLRAISKGCTCDLCGVEEQLCHAQGLRLDYAGARLLQAGNRVKRKAHLLTQMLLDGKVREPEAAICAVETIVARARGFAR
jgi:hypothetical protein